MMVSPTRRPFVELCAVEREIASCCTLGQSPKLSGFFSILDTLTRQIHATPHCIAPHPAIRTRQQHDTREERGSFDRGGLHRLLRHLLFEWLVCNLSSRPTHPAVRPRIIIVERRSHQHRCNTSPGRTSHPFITRRRTIGNGITTSAIMAANRLGNIQGHISGSNGISQAGKSKLFNTKEALLFT
ncbi:repressible alkaline phosphatase precursor [Pseudozyma hubeiensis SY62]|uniref:Repressible alkaline phosphatase n=1 Tax=Pseudozyma hubeiensis (strain SY62) TaxID=1305764 RepID=R9P0V4_PSEHS|nr:repressible alkaline phosphatase precursor [Pseudozyma hubeiensis SY62]GAC94848.1 repressible alkaline phosphatase precursor [Pseudozyma hubeiensis SY62]